MPLSHSNVRLTRLRTIQWYLQTVHRLPLSLSAIVRAIHQVAQKAQPALAEIQDRIRGSPVVHADETGWRQDGVNGYVWTFSTPTDRYFLRRGRNKGSSRRGAGRFLQAGSWSVTSMPLTTITRA